MHNACANVRHIAPYTTGEMLLKHYVKTASICISRLYVYLFIFIYLLCHIYTGVPHQCAALFSLGLLHYMHDKTNINHHTFRYNTVTTLTTWYIRYIITCIMLTIYTCSSLQWLHAGAGSCLINVMYLINVTFDIIAVSWWIQLHVRIPYACLALIFDILIPPLTAYMPLYNIVYLYPYYTILHYYMHSLHIRMSTRVDTSLFKVCHD